MSLRNDRLENSSIYFLNNSLEEVLSFKLLGLTICHDLFWESHISNLASKASCRLRILHRAKSFLDSPEHLTIYKAFVHMMMAYYSPLWVGAPASHLSWIQAVETKAFRIISVSSDEAEIFGLSLSHRRKVVGLSVFDRLLSGLTPPALSAIYAHQISAGRPMSANNLHLVKLPKSRMTAHLHPFISLFSHLWDKLPHSVQSHSSIQAFNTVVHHHLLSSPMQNLDLFYPR